MVSYPSLPPMVLGPASSPSNVMLICGAQLQYWPLVCGFTALMPLPARGWPGSLVAKTWVIQPNEMRRCMQRGQQHTASGTCTLHQLQVVTHPSISVTCTVGQQPPPFQ